MGRSDVDHVTPFVSPSPQRARLVSSLARRLLPRRARAFLRRTFPRPLAGRPPERELRQSGIAPAMTPEGYDIIVLPIIDWFFLFQRPQQLSRRFARDGRRVFYLDLVPLSDGPWQRSDAEAEAIWIEERVALVSRLASRPLDVYVETLDDRQIEDMVRSLDTLRRRFAIGPAVCLVQLPFWTPLALRLRQEWGWHVVYDCMDEHAGFITNAEEMLAFEERLIRESDIVVATSQYLMAKVSEHSHRAIMVGNAADFDHFHKAHTVGEANDVMKNLEHPIIGYHGCLSSWFDMDLINYTAEARPDWSFVLIGSRFGVDREWRNPPANVHFLGRVPYEALPDYLSRFDVCCIPFRVNPLTIASNPVKFFEYLSAGKPVVATPLPELRPYADSVYLADGAEAFVNAIEQALAEDDPDRVAERVAVARANTWQARHRQLDREFRNLLSPLDMPGRSGPGSMP